MTCCKVAGAAAVAELVGLLFSLSVAARVAPAVFLREDDFLEFMSLRDC